MVLKRLSGRYGNGLGCEAWRRCWSGVGAGVLGCDAFGFVLLAILIKDDRTDLTICVFYKLYSGRELAGCEFCWSFCIYFEFGLIGRLRK
jgi:hypothetical protein